MDDIEQEVLKKVGSLIDGSVSRSDIDTWSQTRGEEIKKNLTNNDDFRNEALSDLIDALTLAITPNEDGSWLYNQDDLTTWLEDYQASIENGRLSET